MSLIVVPDTSELDSIFAEARAPCTLTVAFAYEEAVSALVSITTDALPRADAFAYA